MKDSIPHFLKGLQLLELGRYAEAREALLKVLEEKPDFEEALRAMAFSYVREDKGREAVKYAKQAVEANPNGAHNYFVLGQSWAAWDDDEKAEKNLKKAIELDPNAPEFHANIANLYLKKDRYKKTNHHLKIALSLDPENKLALNLKSHYEFLFGRNKEAGEFLEKAMKDNPLSPANHYEAGTQAFYNEKYQEAEKHFLQVIQSDPLDWRGREKYLDSKLAQYWPLKWLFLHYRPFNMASYVSVFFDLFLIVIGGALLREKNHGEPFFPYAQWVIFILTIKSLIFWIGRPIGHYWMKRKVWGIRFINFQGFQFYLNVCVQLALISFLIHQYNFDFLWFATAVLLTIFGIFKMSSYLITHPLKKKVWHWGWIGLITVGSLNFILELNLIENNLKLGDILFLGIFGLPIIMWIWTEVEKRFGV